MSIHTIREFSLEEFSALLFEEIAALTGATRSIKSRPWNPHLIANSAAFETFLADTASLIEKAEERKRRSTEMHAVFMAALRALILDLFSASTADPELQVGIHLDAKLYGAKHRTRYSNQQLTYRQLKAAFDGLEQLGLLQIVKRGWHDKSGRGAITKVTATQALMHVLRETARLQDFQLNRSPDAEVILLRGFKTKKVAELVDYVDDRETEEMRNRLRYINAVIGEHVLALSISDDDLQQLQRRLAQSRDISHKPIEFSARSLHRIFNNGSFQLGGRFYGGWWQNIPQEYRRRIAIDGEPTVEADYAALHPRLLYAKEGLDSADDPYDIGLDPRHRGWVKQAFNALINAGPRGIAQPRDYDPAEVGLEHKALLDRVRAHHQPIAKHFYTGAGLELQFVDSCIAEHVMLHFADRGIACLPVHDSFIIQERYTDELVEIMYCAYEQAVGSELKGDMSRKLIRIREAGSLINLDGL